MTGIEYELLHVQDPILYVIRKQHRISPTQGQLQQIIFSVDYFDLCQENKIILYAITDEHSSLQKYNRWRISTGRKQTSLLQLRSWTRDSLEQIQLLVRAEWGVGLGKPHTLVLEQDCISGTLTTKPHCTLPHLKSTRVGWHKDNFFSPCSYPNGWLLHAGWNCLPSPWSLFCF